MLISLMLYITESLTPYFFVFLTQINKKKKEITNENGVRRNWGPHNILQLNMNFFTAVYFASYSSATLFILSFNNWREHGSLLLFMQSFVYCLFNGTHWVWLNFYPTSFCSMWSLIIKRQVITFCCPCFEKLRDTVGRSSEFLLILASFINSVLIIKLYCGSYCWKTSE